MLGVPIPSITPATRECTGFMEATTLISAWATDMLVAKAVEAININLFARMIISLKYYVD
jgi:hypothetical protein